MAFRSASSRVAESFAPATVRTFACRDCCCGTFAKHPDVDHDAQLAMLEERSECKVVECLGYCEWSNVIVVRTQGGKPIWLSKMNTPEVNEALADWIDAGAQEPLPTLLKRHQFQPKQAKALQEKKKRSKRRG